MKKMKIAVVCNYRLLPDRVGGMDRFYWLFDQKCKQAGFEIQWFFPNKSDHGSYESLTIFAPESNEPLEHFFNRHIRENNDKFDVVMTHFLELCTSFFKKVKAHHASRTIAVDHNPRPLTGYPLKKRIVKKIKGLVFSKYTDLFIGVSEYTKFHIINDFGTGLKNKTIVIYNGILHELYSKRVGRNAKETNFLVASHLRFSKGIQDLISAIGMMPSEIKKKLKIDVYGQGDYKDELLRMIAKDNLQANFNFLGSVPNLYETYYKYDYLLQPTHMECFSLSILESLGANVPVITTAVGGNEEVIKNGENGYIFKAKDVSALKNIVEKVYLGEMGIVADTSKLIEEQFSIEKMVNDYFQLLTNEKK
ncbi:glycosyltransferase family 4 protein [Flavobacterium sp. SM15]|uniref:glycosyltransferase family 4 protein n=1 Tax=Flavobacterium sp. SM15 TaxID=2908005 RepID=UPI001EDC2AF3|nr:glycosyltransferase family 4 protein [Flavobacterium sp. SM15]MCG2611255.1 glycosyltransferase family 4 protein [Flavobacterium sp. SM15]